VIGCDSALYLRVQPAGAVDFTALPDDAFEGVDPREAAMLHAQHHPLVAHYRSSRDVRAWSLHDFITREQFERTALYRKLYRALGIDYQLAMLVPSPTSGVHGVALNRKAAAFTEDERQTLELLWPHVTQATRNMRVLTRLRDRATLATVVEGRGVIVLDREGEVELCTEQARVWLIKYCPHGLVRRKFELPPRVALWVREQMNEASNARGTPVRNEPLLLARDDSFLIIRIILDQGRGQHLMILEEEALRASASALRGLGLTEREAEVLAWVAQSKSNREIGAILGMSARTVQKHLEHVFEKLGVESRTGAILRAWQEGRFVTLGPRGP
jgi:DNA-binding CsgD family transcriptional regulator